MSKKHTSHFWDVFGTVKYTIGIAWKDSVGKKYIPIRAALAVFRTVFPLIYIFIPGYIINELTGGHRIEVLIIYLAILCISPLISHLIELTVGVYAAGLRRKLSRRLEENFHIRVSEIDFEALEKPDIAIIRERISHHASAPIYMLDNVVRFFESVLGILALSSVITTLNPVFLIMLIAIAYVNSLVTKRIYEHNHQNEIQLGELYNPYWIYQSYLGDHTYEKEIRLFDAKPLFISIFSKKGKEIDQCYYKEDKYSAKMQTIHAFTGMFQQITLYLYLIYSVLFRSMSIGTMTIYLNSVNNFSNSLSRVSQAYLEIGKLYLDIKEYIDFFNLPEMQRESGSRTPVFSSDSIIEFKNVSFKYPGSETYALKDLNIKIRCNEKLCIVGANGSGKTTFVKLLTRLYAPTDGEILLDGVNIKEFDYHKYQKLFSPVFQDYNMYSLSIAANISLAENCDENRVERAVEKSGLSGLIHRLSKGQNTSVLKDIDASGFEPSGGEGQKIAIARAIYRDSPIYLLDEPTAALDPAAEYEIYSNFSKMITDRTAILITHRMSAVQLAENIAVFNNGSVAEYGKHKDLYDQGGIYREMFDKQAQFYRDIDNDAN